MLFLKEFSSTSSGRCENPECEIWRNMPEYHGICRKITEYHGISRHFPGMSLGNGRGSKVENTKFLSILKVLQPFVLQLVLLSKLKNFAYGYAVWLCTV
jgi:hypothetical protein